MELLLKRIAKKDTYTIGRLYVDGKYFCDTLEDADRGLDNQMPLSDISDVKIKGKTAIPTGKYKVVMNVVSPKFQDRSWAKPYEGKIPRLLDVPCFKGVCIHVGNKPQDTEGCPLVGKNKIKGELVDSVITFMSLMEKHLWKAKMRGESVFITIV